jgi:hypothetical protein
MIVGDPSGFDVGAVEKDSQPLSSFAGRCASVCSSNSLATSALFEQSGELEAVMQITHAAVRGGTRHLRHALNGRGWSRRSKAARRNPE